MYLSTDGSHLVRHNDHLQAHRLILEWHADGSTLLVDTCLLQAGRQGRAGFGLAMQAQFTGTIITCTHRGSPAQHQCLARCLHRLQRRAGQEQPAPSPCGANSGRPSSGVFRSSSPEQTAYTMTGSLFTQTPPNHLKPRRCNSCTLKLHSLTTHLAHPPPDGPQLSTQEACVGVWHLGAQDLVSHNDQPGCQGHPRGGDWLVARLGAAPGTLQAPVCQLPGRGKGPVFALQRSADRWVRSWIVCRRAGGVSQAVSKALPFSCRDLQSSRDMRQWLVHAH